MWESIDVIESRRIQLASGERGFLTQMQSSSGWMWAAMVVKTIVELGENAFVMRFATSDKQVMADWLNENNVAWVSFVNEIE